MTYTTLAALAVPVALAVDLLVLRTRLVTTSSWWIAYGIVFGFQLLTNGWLTGRGIVRYAGDAIIGSGRITFVGDGRFFWAPVEDLGFGFALVLLSCAWWARLRPRATPEEAAPDDARDRRR
ncbi:MAG TPA: lycopene cyclase domain-containing protein [Segeticoccus sp.]|nr:lycopene cyclase domain-containing protein [Segeticoccus sp.]